MYSNKQTNKIHPYTDKQFEEDFKKMLIETKTIHADKVDKLIEQLLVQNLKYRPN